MFNWYSLIINSYLITINAINVIPIPTINRQLKLKHVRLRLNTDDVQYS